jgi:nucleoside-diphosphate-sugar epimerase
VQVILTAPRGELAGIVSRALDDEPVRADGPRVVINVSLQAPNNLLHDGHAWKRYPPERLLAETRAAVRRASRADFLVHASYVVAGADAAGLRVGEKLRPIVDAALQAEEIALAAPVPACVVRLGYMYGPESRNLRAYRRAFRLGRPYWAGPDDVQQRHLHSHDAARALLAAARQRPAGRMLSASDNLPVSFATFMDHFARLVGNPLPVHLPGISRLISHVVVAEEHMQMVEIATGNVPAGNRPRGFTPVYVNYRKGLQQVVDQWAT